MFTKGRTEALAAAAVLSALFAAAAFGATLVATGSMGRAPAGVSASPGSAASPFGRSEIAARVAAGAEPSVVTVSSGVLSVNPEASPSAFVVAQAGAGSGFIVADVLVLTSYHAVRDNSSLTVTLHDGTHYRGAVVDINERLDLALVRIRAAGLRPLTLGDSDTVRVGQFSLAMTGGFGQPTGSASAGIVSGLNRTLIWTDPETEEDTRVEGLIQTDLSVTGASAGGPLLDASGSVVGVILTYPRTAPGVTFAVPIDLIKPFVENAG